MALAYHVPGYIPDFRTLPSNQLDAFIAQYLQPDETFHALASTALDTLCRYLQNVMRPNVRRIVKSGSMGKGTAIKNSSDLDCILIMNNIEDAAALRANIATVLSQIRSFLESQPFAGQGWFVTVRRVNEYLVQFDMANTAFNMKTVNVDLLQTFDANVSDGQSRQNLYRSMASCDATTRSYCSAALAEIQRDFVQERPAKVKDLIRLVKHWAKTYVIGLSTDLRMPSYLIELVTIYCWEQAGSPDYFNTAVLFRAIMVALFNHTNFNIKWERYYILNQSASLPRILDPANPYNNVYNDVNCWHIVKQVAWLSANS